MQYRAYSPGSITLFFVPRENHRKYEKKGSLGVSITTELGAVTEVKEGDRIKVYINGKREKNTIQHRVAKLWRFKGDIRTVLQLPISQGLGMSGAGALSTSLAIADLRGDTYLQALRIAHRAEIENKTGLGDVVSQYSGGFTIRLKEGIPPYGLVDKIAIKKISFKIIILSKGIKTREILDSEKRKIIEESGEKIIRKFLKKKTMENAVKLGREFSIKIGIFSPEIYEFMKKCEYATPCNIGNSIVIFGDCSINKREVIETRLGEHAKIL